MSVDWFGSSDCLCECEGPAAAQRMVSDAIVAAVKEVISKLQVGDLSRAQAHISGLIELLDGIPASTAELFERQTLAMLSRDLRFALRETGKREGALDAMHRILLTWSGPSQSAFLT